MTRYAMVVFWSQEDSAWIADAPDLRSCSAHGETPEKAVAELQIAMDAWIATSKSAGHTLPVPKFQPHAQAAE
jgi:predicted RNase H-like HicB family nuclease